MKLSGEARNVLDTSLDKWNWWDGRIWNPNLHMAKEREAVRFQRRMYYHMHALWARKISSTNSNATAPSPSDVDEPRDIDEFLDKLLINFEATSAVNLQSFYDFKHNPRDILHMLGTLFNLIVVVIEWNNLMSSRSLALALPQHLPVMICDTVEEKMKDQDLERAELRLPLTEWEELMTMARKAESTVRKLEAEYRVAGVPLRPRKGAIQPESIRSQI